MGGESRIGRHHAAADDEEPSGGPEAAGAAPAVAGRPTIRLPLDDPYQVPDGYPIKASASFGLYYTPESPLYDDTLAEFWLSSEEVAQANGFVKAD
ncbi:sunset domain-containing protein [Mycobacterium interjectum]